jgi:sensor histidine kinase YesM
VQRLLTRVVFLRTGAENALRNLSALASAARSEQEFLQLAVQAAAATYSAVQMEVSRTVAPQHQNLRRATPVVDHPPSGSAAWVEVIAPVRLSRGDVHYLGLGPRAGGRRYLSEDLDLLDRMTTMIAEQIERMRESEMQELVTQAEMRALQAQINPHFFFNALNTLYGVIPREGATARRLVLNLADLFRHSFASERVSIRIEEEVRIVRAYLEIEQLRLGSRLQVEIDVDPAALNVEVPVLSIQPLVENAVRHGVAARPGNGFVAMRIQAVGRSVRIEIVNSGGFRLATGGNGGTGVGLANVRRRLTLCFGAAGELDIKSDDDLTRVSFLVPMNAVATAARNVGEEAL